MNVQPTRGPLTRAVLRALRLYREAVSPLRPPCCRFTPTCSAYAIEAVEVHGLTRGCWLALRRLSRCHPLHRGGHDPVPTRVGGMSGAAGAAADDDRPAQQAHQQAHHGLRHAVPHPAGSSVDSVPA